MAPQQIFIASTLFKSISSNSQYKSLFEECFTLVKAYSLEEASEKIIRSAINKQSTFKNEKGEEISWTFIKLNDINNILYDISFEEGDEIDIYSRHFTDIELYEKHERDFLDM